MGLLKSLFGFGPRNPTEGFPKRLVPPLLVWDHASLALCGIPLPAPVASLAPLGPAEGFRAMNERYWILTYPDLGLEIEVNGGQAQHFTLRISEEPGDDPQPGKRFARPTLEPGRVAVDLATSLESVRKALGEGRVMFEDEEETVHLFERAHVAVEAAYAGDGRLVRLEIYNNHE